MSLSILLVFVLTLGTESVQSDSRFGEDRDPNLDRRTPVSVQEVESNPGITALGDSIWGFDTQTPTGDNGCLGMEFDGTFFWVTGRNAAQGDTHKLHKFDSLGNLIITYDQGTSSIWGWRDLAWDGTYLYASDSPLVTQIDPATGAPTGFTFSGPQNPNRALAFDPATRHFWTANFGSSIYEFDSTGTLINTYANTRAIYGMAWDDASPGGPWLWISAQEGGGVTDDTVYQFNPASGTYTGVQFPVSTLAGGCAFSTEWDDTLGVLFYMNQGIPVDRIVAYEIAVIVPVHNVGTSAINLPGTIVPPNTPLSPEVTFCNTGDFAETLWVNCEIDSSGFNVYSDSSQVVGLLADSCTTVIFNPWTPGDLCNTYTVTSYTQLSGDNNPNDDTLTSQTSTFTEVLEIQSGLASAPPTFDGVINPGEWADATMIDVSDVLAKSSMGVSPCNVNFYVMNDATHLYVAVDYLLDGTLNVNDRVLLYLDDDHDHAWASDTSEGVYRLFYAAGFNSLFSPMPSGPNTGPPVPGVMGEVALGANIQFEIAIPFGSLKYELEASPSNNDTVGLHVGVVNQGTFEEEGWWPTSLESTNETDPAFYGDLILAFVVPGVEEENDNDKLKIKNGKFELLQNTPNPFSHNTAIRFTLPASGFASLKIYDLTGRLVKTLHEGEMKKGLHTLTWDQRDNSGREVTTGVYFYRLQSRFGQAEEKEATRKLVVIKNTEK